MSIYCMHVLFFLIFFFIVLIFLFNFYCRLIGAHDGYVHLINLFTLSTDSFHRFPKARTANFRHSGQIGYPQERKRPKLDSGTNLDQNFIIN